MPNDVNIDVRLRTRDLRRRLAVLKSKLKSDIGGAARSASRDVGGLQTRLDGLKRRIDRLRINTGIRGAAGGLGVGRALAGGGVIFTAAAMIRSTVGDITKEDADLQQAIKEFKEARIRVFKPLVKAFTDVAGLRPAATGLAGLESGRRSVTNPQGLDPLDLVLLRAQRRRNQEAVKQQELFNQIVLGGPFGVSGLIASSQFQRPVSFLERNRLRGEAIQETNRNRAKDIAQFLGGPFGLTSPFFGGRVLDETVIKPVRERQQRQAVLESAQGLFNRIQQSAGGREGERIQKKIEENTKQSAEFDKKTAEALEIIQENLRPLFIG